MKKTSALPTIAPNAFGNVLQFPVNKSAKPKSQVFTSFLRHFYVISVIFTVLLQFFFSAFRQRPKVFRFAVITFEFLESSKNQTSAEPFGV